MELIASKAEPGRVTGNWKPNQTKVPPQFSFKTHITYIQDIHTYIWYIKREIAKGECEQVVQKVLRTFGRFNFLQRPWDNNKLKFITIITTRKERQENPGKARLTNCRESSQPQQSRSLVKMGKMENKWAYKCAQYCACWFWGNFCGLSNIKFNASLTLNLNEYLQLCLAIKKIA